MATPNLLRISNLKKKPINLPAICLKTAIRFFACAGKCCLSPGEKNSKVITYSNIGDIPLVTNIYFNQLEFAESRDKQSAVLEIGTDHKICEDLQEIGLSETPVVYQYSPLNQAILFAGRNLIDH